MFNTAEAMQPRTVRLTIVGARNLRNADPVLMGSSDPYVVVELSGKPETKFQTKVINNELNPTWNHVADIQGWIPGDAIEFTIWDKDMWPKSDDLLGKATLHSQDMYPHGFSGEIAIYDEEAKPGAPQALLILEVAPITQVGTLMADMAHSHSHTGLSEQHAPHNHEFTPKQTRRPLAAAPAVAPMPAPAPAAAHQHVDAQAYSHSQADLHELRRRAVEALEVAQEAISSRGVMEFRARMEVPQSAKAVTIAAVCMISGLDGAERRHHRENWDTAQEMLRRPGSFVDAFRKFPLAVDAGNFPVENVIAAKEALEGVRVEDLTHEAFAQNLHRWIIASWRYCELAPPPRSEQQHHHYVEADVQQHQQQQQMHDLLMQPSQHQAQQQHPQQQQQQQQQHQLHQQRPASRQQEQQPQQSQPRSPHPPKKQPLHQAGVNRGIASSTSTGSTTGGDSARAMSYQLAKAAAASTLKLEVSIIQATGLKHMNFTGDAPWCSCEVQHTAARSSPCRIQTKPVPRTLDPVWNETHEIDSWHVGEPLMFGIYDKGLLGSKTEGNVIVPSEQFYPHGFEGQLPIAGLDHALLTVRIVPFDSQQSHVSSPASSRAAAANQTQPSTARPSTASTGMRGSRTSPSPPAHSRGHVRGASPPAPRGAAGLRHHQPGAPSMRPATRVAASASNPGGRVPGFRGSQAPASRPRTAGAGGYSATAPPGRPTVGSRTMCSKSVSTEDWRAKLDQLRKETRDMKSMEAQIKWSMKREEGKLRNSERKEDRKHLMEWQQQQRKEASEFSAAMKKEIKAVELAESKEFQETKRVVKQIAKEDELIHVTEDYCQTKENADWRVELKKVTESERRRLVIEDNLERYRTVAEHNLEEQQREKMDRMQDEIAREQTEMSMKMMQAQLERERALASLEHLKGQQHSKVPEKKHLSARP